ncbi:MAG: hypothetical protein IPO90_14965 [Flavobacteriales bacterium]|nr:hypothetical protein [Flavobacteriales bacterium]
MSNEAPGRWPFQLMPIEVVVDEEAIGIALRAREEGDETWVPISAGFAEELRADAEVARIEWGVALIPQTRRWDMNTMCYCVLLADKHRWRSHGLLRILSFAEFADWQDEWDAGSGSWARGGEGGFIRL